MSGRKGTREEPGTLTQGGVLFSLVPLVWESNPKLQGGWCKPNQPIGGSDPKHQGIWSLPWAGQKFWKGQHDTVFTHRCWARNLFFSRSLTTKLQGCPCNKTPREQLYKQKEKTTQQTQTYDDHSPSCAHCAVHAPVLDGFQGCLQAHRVCPEARGSQHGNRGRQQDGIPAIHILRWRYTGLDERVVQGKRLTQVPVRARAAIRCIALRTFDVYSHRWVSCLQRHPGQVPGCYCLQPCERCVVMEERRASHARFKLAVPRQLLLQVSSCERDCISAAIKCLSLD